MTAPAPTLSPVRSPLGRDAEGALWVFGYGSLIWNPGFAFTHRLPARLDGFRRSFCLRSVRYRGTPEAPGLVLALAEAPESRCRGLAFRVAPEQADEVHAYLRWREMDTDSYLETVQELALDAAPDGISSGVSTVRALAYVIDPDHPHHVRLPEAAQAEIIAAAHGPAGSNRDYLLNTVAHLQDLGLPDPELEALAGQVAAIPAAARKTLAPRKEEDR